MLRRLCTGQAALAEGLRVVLLAAAAVCVIEPLLTGPWFAAGDAARQHALLADFLEQVRAGVFPVYVGQTANNWNGSPYVRAPGFCYTSALIDLMTGRQCSALTIQQLTLLFCVTAGVLAMYFALAARIPGRRWAAYLFALLYGCCPGMLFLLF